MKRAKSLLLLPLLALLFLQQPIMAQEAEGDLSQVVVERVFADGDGPEVFEKVVKQGFTEHNMGGTSWIMGEVAEDRSWFDLNIIDLDVEALSLEVQGATLIPGLDYEMDAATGRVTMLNQDVQRSSDPIIVKYTETGSFPAPFKPEFDFSPMQSITVIKHGFEKEMESGRPLLGVYPSTTEEGVYISSMVDYCGAVEAGIKSGDIIKSLDGKPVSTVSELREIIQSNEPGYEMEVTYLRDGQEYTVNSVLCEREVKEVVHREYMKGLEHMARMKKEIAQQDGPLLGVYPETRDEGVYITSMVDYCGAVQAGINAGDVITSLDGKSVTTVGELHDIIQSHEPGYEMDVTYIRDGQTYNVTSVLCQKQSKVAPSPDRPLLGVYPTNNSEAQGVYVSRMVDYCGAVNAGIQAGDYITELDGKQINSVTELHNIIQGHKPGYEMPVTYVRDGQEFNVTSTLCQKENGFEFEVIERAFNDEYEFRFDAPDAPDAPEAPEAPEAPRGLNAPPAPPAPPAPAAPRIIHFEGDGNEVIQAMGYHSDNPKPWIGIVMQGSEDQVELTRIVEGSPAEAAGLQVGDVLVSIDEVGVSQPGGVVELMEGRSPGDVIVVSVKRNGGMEEVELELAERDEDVNIEVQRVIEWKMSTDELEMKTWTKEYEVTIGAAKAEPFKNELVDFELQLDDFNVFPNPTAGNLNINFQAQQGDPVTVTLTDASGRMVYENRIQAFDGLYNDQVEIVNAVPGPMILTVTQGGKKFNTTVIYGGRP